MNSDPHPIFAAMKAVIRFVPNLFTLANLGLGMLGIVFAAREEMVWSVYCIGIALVLDFLDGFVARMLKAQSELGKELDSLADLVTFGVLPGFILFQMITVTRGLYFIDIHKWESVDFWATGVALLVPMAAGLRLATFNLDTVKRNHFLGLPTPSMTIIVAAIPLILEEQYHLNFYHPLSENLMAILGKARRWDPLDYGVVRMMMNPVFYQVIAVMLAALMLVRIPMLSLKFQGFSWQKNKWRYFLGIWALVVYAIFLVPYILWIPLDWGVIDYLVIPIFMMGYFVLSWIYATFEALKKTD